MAAFKTSDVLYWGLVVFLMNMRISSFVSRLHLFFICFYMICITQLSAGIYRLDGRHVVFGKVISGMDIVYKVEAEGTQSGTPKRKVIIVDSGELPL